MFNSLRNKILIYLVCFSLLLLTVIILLNNHYSDKKEQKSALIEHFLSLENTFLKIFKNSNAFFSNDMTNQTFFELGKSKYIDSNDLLIHQATTELTYLKDLSLKQHINIQSETDTIFNYVEDFNVLFKKIITLMRERGYKDYGIEGEMRNQIHKLEKLKNVNQVEMLMLRRHEKDYMIRREKQYIDKLVSTAEDFRQNIILSKSINKYQKDSLLVIIDKYVLDFKKLVELDQQIGIRENTALKGQFDLLSVSLENKIKELIDKVKLEKDQILKQARISYFTYLLIAIILSILVSLWITRRVTRSLNALTAYISDLTNQDFNSNVSLRPDAYCLK